MELRRYVVLVLNYLLHNCFAQRSLAPKGLVTYLIRRGYQDGVLIKFATAIRTRYEVTDPGTPEFNLWDRWDNSFDWMVRELIAGFWLSLTALGHREISSLANKFDQMPLWPELYIICRAAQRYVFHANDILVNVTLTFVLFFSCSVLFGKSRYHGVFGPIRVIGGSNAEGDSQIPNTRPCARS